MINMFYLLLEAWPSSLVYGDTSTLVMGTWIFMLVTCLALLAGMISMIEDGTSEPEKRKR